MKRVVQIIKGNLFIVLFLLISLYPKSIKIYAGPGVTHKYIALPITNSEKMWVDSIMSTLTTRERIAQLFMMPAYSNKDEKHTEEIKETIEKYKIGGLIFFQGTAQKQAELTNLYQSVSQLPMLIAIDGEWGVGMRLKEIISFPKQMALGGISNTDLIYEFATEMARQCKLLGIHINFAPTVDVNNNPNNPVINFRSFGENQYAVAEKGVIVMKGLQDHGIMACAKHFPGHGDTDADSHNTLPELDQTIERLDSVELVPFNRLIDEGVSMVMVGHLYVKAIEKEDNKPASISKSVITDFLKNELNFSGLVVSDALNMKGVRDYAEGLNIAVEALKAGHDILLMPDKVLPNIEAIEEAIKKNELTQEIIDKKCRSVLTAKFRVGLNNYKPIETAGIKDKLNSQYAQALKNRLTESFITLVRNENNILPLKDMDKHSYGYLEIGDGKDFEKSLLLYSDIKTANISSNPTEKDIENVHKKLNTCDIIIVGYHETTQTPSKDFGFTQTALDAILSIGNKKSMIFNFFGSPYVLGRIPEIDSIFDAVIISYDNSAESQDRTAQMIFGGIPFNGKLPVSSLPHFSVGDGIETYTQTRLKYVIPEEININSEHLKAIDSLAKQGITRSAFPGCQVIALHKGQVFYHKAFGKHSYNKDSKNVKLTDIYDVASVTKTSATLPIIMQMVDDNKLDLDNTIDDYIQLYKRNDRVNITVRDLLLHKAGLPSWIPFYQKYLVVPNGDPLFSNKKTAVYSINIPGTSRYMNNTAHLDKKYFSNKRTSVYNQAVAENIFVSKDLKKEIYNQMDTVNLRNKTYRYSDLSFIYLQRIIETIYKIPEDQLAEDLFYAPLGMNNTLFNPQNRISKTRIIPTENDKIFRRQHIHSYVHDQTAAMLGGVSGHAGLFSNVNDLAKLYQMFLNKGLYGGANFLSDKVIDEFTEYGDRNNSRRGLGFDKREVDPKKTTAITGVSEESYGHLGFTGTMVWVDPKRELIFVFLSNRINPSAENNMLSKLETRAAMLNKFVWIIDQIENNRNN